MRKIPVTRDGKKGSETILISSEDVVKLDFIRKHEYLVHTLDEVFYYSNSPDAFEEWLYEDGFRLIDQNNLVNMNYITQYDTVKGTVYLGTPDNQRQKSASAARIHREHILNVMEMLRIASSEQESSASRGSDFRDKLRDVIPLNDDDQFHRSYAMIQAIYERTRAEKLLEQSEQRYKSLYENNPDGICSFDIEGNFISVNPAAERITGYPADELMQKSMKQIIVPEAFEQWQQSFMKAVRGGTDIYRISFLHKLGHPVPLSLLTVPIVVDDDIAGVYVIFKDISEEKRAEELLIKSEKLSVVGQLAAGVAHEIRNPLTSLKGFVQLLKSKTSEHDFYYDIMLSELERINFIVSEFLVIAKPQAVYFQPKELKDILANTIILLNSQATMKNVTIQSRMDKQVPPILCDENQIKQVCINILTNSIDAMPGGGDITVEIHPNGDGEIALIFTDTGSGIPEDRIPRLGEPFYTTKEKGTGLGLMVSYRIIENHHGRINIQSRLNLGTIVEIILPTYEENKKPPYQ
ncbi:PAS domain-containing sensor histidine kinase [Paenibacillus sedimenti]|uniref:histidine kinase n=1 Tax=Paenibacillus sedimenti TaxID=2770274 RepID=A0A926KTG3_9BACL|nr:ATP-binding protein [Paenibacillus sedimenti]MBD0382596.1 PAS domain S-box protein [Paenibacillus sedimenti]